MKALEIDPDYVSAQLWRSLLLSTTGRHEEAVPDAARVLGLDPLSAFLNMYLGAVLVWADRPEDAIRSCQASLALDGNYVQAHRYLGQAFEKVGNIENAAAEYRKAVELSGGALGLGDLGHLYGISGREAEAKLILSRLEDRSERRYLAPVEMVRLYAGLGDKEKLHEWLENADQERAGEFLFLRWTPVGKTLKGDPKFEEILRRMGL